MKEIIAIDKWLFTKINGNGFGDSFDTIMLLVRNPFFWIPLYIFMVLLIVINFGKKATVWLFFLICNVTLTDTISSKIIKPFFARPRPCADPEFASQVRLIASYCGGNGSFTSSHAANHFGIAMFIFITLGFLNTRWRYLFFVWAIIICYAQIYVGVHYPTDIIGGGILGCTIGLLMGTFFNKKFTVLHKINNL